MEGQAPENQQTEGTFDSQEPGPSQGMEGRKKKRTQPAVSESDSEDSESEWQGTSIWQNNIPQSIETPDFINLSVPKSFKKIMWGGYVDLGAFRVMTVK